MVNYKEILRLLNEGYSQREIERSLHTSRRKIREFLDEATHHNITWPLEESVTNEAIEAILFPERYSAGSLPQVPLRSTCASRRYGGGKLPAGLRFCGAPVRLCGVISPAKWS